MQTLRASGVIAILTSSAPGVGLSDRKTIDSSILLACISDALANVPESTK